MPKYKIYGKSHFEGTSKKTGKPYCFNVIHTLGAGRNVEGFEAKQLNLDARMFPFDSIPLNTVVQIDFDEHGFIVDMVPVKSEEK